MSCFEQYPTIEIKRGDSFTLACTYKQDGVPYSLVGYSIAAQVRNSSRYLIEQLTLVVLDQVTNVGGFTLSSAGTSLWPIDLLDCDIELTLSASNIRSTETFRIKVLEDITHA